MNNIIENIVTRRSVRTYKEDQITDEELMLILKAGQYAPNAMGRQSFKLVAVQKKDLLARINNGCQKIINGKSSPLYGAPTIVIAFAKINSIAPANDASVALENVMLAAASLGVSSCWIHSAIPFFKTEEGKSLKEEMGVSDEYDVYGSCVLGYNDEKNPIPTPRQDTAVIIK